MQSCSVRQCSRNVHRARQYQWLAVDDGTPDSLVQLAMGSKYVSDRKGHSNHTMQTGSASIIGFAQHLPHVYDIEP